MFSTALAQVPQIPSFTVSSQSVRQGDVLIITLSPYSRVPRAVVRIFDKNFEPNKFGMVYVGIHPETKPGKYRICLVDGYIYWYCAEIEVLGRKFPEVRIPRNRKSIDTNRWKKDRAKINKAYQKADKYEDYREGQLFIGPLGVITVTDGFYLRRKFLDGISIHRGIDIKAPIGMPVCAINSGKVILADYNFLLEGNMVILDHGSGIFSYYLHLLRINVREGQFVRKGEVVALSGDTGLGVRDPHLHFAVKVYGVSVDPLESLKTMNENLNR